ncbi:hypothetical protein K493DRAFT_308470 [Basidiobolus meristosporus CBS 931.73]|uniref:Uncharacterized protein n=1 Tax=Basidiobolus meristosporus CBS 931.73 TaxID=1314790 RepID=A0A1Y1X3I2_9FUNG|nr:hypothetical protein K493DRAFT_308470 [Basidiobolus meristosporus CBS 931.73]|eukprot:ORX79874.1 hypothetical protein K493DRAFT_308470 [Basidiobolus meristosporus CBS 931.73]
MVTRIPERKDNVEALRNTCVILAFRNGRNLLQLLLLKEQTPRANLDDTLTIAPNPVTCTWEISHPKRQVPNPLISHPNGEGSCAKKGMFTANFADSRKQQYSPKTSAEASKKQRYKPIWTQAMLFIY